MAGGAPRQPRVGLAGDVEEAHRPLRALRRPCRGAPVLGLGRQPHARGGCRPLQRADRAAQPEKRLVGGEQGQGRDRPRLWRHDPGGRGADRRGDGKRDVGLPRRCRTAPGSGRPWRRAGRGGAARHLGGLAAQRPARHAGMDQDSKDRRDAVETDRRRDRPERRGHPPAHPARAFQGSCPPGPGGCAIPVPPSVLPDPSGSSDPSNGCRWTTAARARCCGTCAARSRGPAGCRPPRPRSRPRRW